MTLNNKKAQAATEYLVILAIILVIISSSAFIVLNSINGTEQTQTKIGVQIGELSLLNYQVDLIGTKMHILNDRSEHITITNITINGILQNQSKLPLTLIGGEDYTLTTYTTYLVNQTEYAHTVVVSGIQQDGEHFVKTFDITGTSVELASDFLTVQRSEPVAENITLLFSFDDAVNHAGYGGSGTFGLGTSLSSTEYVLGSHLYCSGSAGSFDSAHNEAFTLGNQFTLAFWFGYFDGGGAVGDIVFKSGSYEVNYTSSSSVQFNVWSGASSQLASIASLPTLSTMAHYVFTYELNGTNATTHAYKNGVLVDTDILTGISEAQNNVSSLNLCSKQVRLDEVMAWQRILTPEEIEMLYRRGN